MNDKIHKMPLTKDERIMVRLPGALRLEAYKAAESQYMTLSEYVRSVIANDVLRRAAK